MASPVRSTVHKEQKPTSPPVNKLADAVRELIRDELGHPQNEKEHTPPVWMEVIWVTVVVVNVVLLISQLPEAALKNTSFEFASKLVGYIFGGVLLVYSSWVKERLMALTAVRWFRTLQIGILILLITSRLPLFSVQPVLPPGARLFIDDGDTAVHLKRGHPLSFTLGSHTIRVAAKEGEEKLTNGVKIRENQFTISWTDLLFQAYRGPAAAWSPLYPIYVACSHEYSKLELTREGRLPESLADADTQDVAAEMVGLQTLRLTLDKARGATAYVPLGLYNIHEVRQDGTVCSDLPNVRVEEKDNRADLADQACPGQR